MTNSTVTPTTAISALIANAVESQSDLVSYRANPSLTEMIVSEFLKWEDAFNSAMLVSQ